MSIIIIKKAGPQNGYCSFGREEDSYYVQSKVGAAVALGHWSCPPSPLMLALLMTYQEAWVPLEKFSQAAKRRPCRAAALLHPEPGKLSSGQHTPTPLPTFSPHSCALFLNLKRQGILWLPSSGSCQTQEPRAFKRTILHTKTLRGSFYSNVRASRPRL